MNTVSVEAQNLLTKAFATSDLTAFRQALTQGANPNLMPTDESGNRMSIFEEALSKRGYFRFIQACLDSGCDINYINPRLKKAAINFAADSKDARNLGALLDYKGLKVQVDYLYHNETTLHRLVKDLNVKGNDCDGIACCIDMLLRKGASPNILDGDDKTAMQYLLQPTSIPADIRIPLLYTFLLMPELSLPQCCEGLELILGGGLNTVLYKLLCHKEESVLKALEFMLQNNSPMYNDQLLAKVMDSSSWTTVLRLLQFKKLKLQSHSLLLEILIQRVQPGCSEYEKCVQQLISLDRKSSLNALDIQGHTPLHYAVKYRNEYAIHALLRQGAYLGLRNAQKRLIIEDMNVSLLEEHFDYCITSRDKKPSHKENEVIINFMNIKNSKNELDLAPIAYMASCKELCHLLQHPLITCVLQLKWQRLSTIFYTHFLIFMLFSISLATYGLLRFPEHTQYAWTLWLVRVICCLMIGYMLIENTLMYLMVKDVPSLIDVPLIILLILTCTEYGPLEFQRLVVVLAILLLAWKLMILIGALPVPAISTHMLMLRQVSRTFLISLALYSMLLLTFAIIFYIQFSQTSDSDIFLTFTLPAQAFLKTLVMFAGQYEFTDFKSYSSSLILLLFMFMTIVLTNLLSGLAVNDTQTIQAQVELNAAICRTTLLSRYEVALKDNWSSCNWLRKIFHKVAKFQLDSSDGYLSIFSKDDNKAFVYFKMRRNKSLESLPNSYDDISLQSVYLDHENSENSDVDYRAIQFCCNTQEDIEINDNNYPSERYVKVTIDNKTVRRTLEILKQKYKTEVQEQREENNEKRLEEIFTVLKEIKTKLLAENSQNIIES